jgi:hypothetical protein
MKQYRVTFVNHGFIAGVFYNRSNNKTEAIESAKLHMNSKWSSVRAENVDDDNDDDHGLSHADRAQFYGPSVRI